MERDSETKIPTKVIPATVVPTQRATSAKSTVTTEGQGVVPFPGCPARRASLVIQMTLAA